LTFSWLSPTGSVLPSEIVPLGIFSIQLQNQLLLPRFFLFCAAQAAGRIPLLIQLSRWSLLGSTVGSFTDQPSALLPINNDEQLNS
jgi:hypothetical protein